MTKHLQVRVEGIEVDEGIADLLGALWSLGFRTEWSCEGGRDIFGVIPPFNNSGATYIVFPRAEEAFAFARATVHLLGSCAYYDGGINLSIIDPMGPGAARGSVRFSPRLLRDVTLVWKDVVSSGVATSRPDLLSESITRTRPLPGFEASTGSRVSCG